MENKKPVKTSEKLPPIKKTLNNNNNNNNKNK